MLKMNTAITILGFFTFLAAISVSPALCTIRGKTTGKSAIDASGDSNVPINNEQRYKRSLGYFSSGLRVGRKTPVYIAHSPGPNKPVNYTMLKIGIVEEAIDEWMIRPTDGWSNINYYWNSKNHPVERSIKDDKSTVESDDQEEEFARFKRAVRLNVARLDIPILISMDYPSSWPNNEKDQEKYIKEQILYAISFWNAISYRYRHEVNPKLRIFITGIVIGRNKGAAPYLRKKEDEKGLRTDNAWYEVDVYFKHQTLGHPTRHDSPLRFDPIITVMTESKAAGGFTNNPLHNHEVLFCDNHLFSAVRDFNYTNWVTINLEGRIPSYVQRHPRSVRKFFGRRIKILPMPGQVISPNKQCEFYGFKPDNQVCYIWDPCGALPCSVGFGFPCHQFSPPIDGTFCSEGQVCMIGKCVKNIEMMY